MHAHHQADWDFYRVGLSEPRAERIAAQVYPDALEAYVRCYMRNWRIMERDQAQCRAS